MEDYGFVIVDAYRTYDTSHGIVMEGFVGSGDPTLHFVFDETKEILYLAVKGDCKARQMREVVRSMGHNLYLPFTKSLQPTTTILRKVCLDYGIDNSFRPTRYSDPERSVTGAVEVPEIIAKYGHVYILTPTHYWDYISEIAYRSIHHHEKEQMYVEWENPREQHIKWKQIMWMKNEFHYGTRCVGFERIERYTPFEDATLALALHKEEVGRLSGLMNKMLEDFKKYGSTVERLRKRTEK